MVMHAGKNEVRLRRQQDAQAFVRKRHQHVAMILACSILLGAAGPAISDELEQSRRTKRSGQDQ